MRKIILLTLSVLLISCGTSRKVIESKSRSTIETEQAVHVEIKEKTEEAVVKTTDLSEGEEIITKVIEFDTTLPISPDTGTPPVARISTQTKQRVTKIQETEASEKQIDTELTEDKKENTLQDAILETQDTSKKGLNWVQMTLCIVGAATILTFALWVIVRRFKR